MSGPGEPFDPRDEADGEAAEYALGLLEPAARRRFERGMERDEGLRRRVEDWNRRLAPLLDAVDPVAAPPAVLPALDAHLDRMARRGPAGRAAAPAGEGLVSRLWKWFGLGAFGLLTASVLALFVLTQSLSVAPPITAVIGAENGPALYAAVIDGRQRRATLIPVARLAADPAHSHELWVLAPGAEPRSLGLLRPDAPVEVRLTPDLLAGTTALAVSLEPEGGSPIGQPTGPVIGTGTLRRI